MAPFFSEGCVAKILFVWELGNDYGHLARLLPIAQELAGRGHEPIFVVRDLMGAESLVVPHGFDVYQAPMWVGSITNLPVVLSYPEMLIRFGFLNTNALCGIARAWRNLVALIKPDLLVFDHAPTALLATRGLKLPRLIFGDGFGVPPQMQPLPPFRWWHQENLKRITDSEAHVLATCNEVLGRLGESPLARFNELFDCDETCLLSFPEMDHYRERHGGNFIGPVFLLGKGASLVWPGSAGMPRIFAYLKPGYAHLENILNVLKRSSASVIVHVPGASRKMVSDFSTPNMLTTPELLDFKSIQAETDLCLCHGGCGTVSAMLVAGKPLMLFPMHTEQEMMAHRLVEQGVALLATAADSVVLARVVHKALSDSELAESARRFALACTDYDQFATIRKAANYCEALIR